MINSKWWEVKGNGRHIFITFLGQERWLNLEAPGEVINSMNCLLHVYSTLQSKLIAPSIPLDDVQSNCWINYSTFKLPWKLEVNNLILLLHAKNDSDLVSEGVTSVSNQDAISLPHNDEDRPSSNNLNACSTRVLLFCLILLCI